MGTGKIIFGFFMIICGIILLFFLPFIGIALILSGISFIIFNKDEDTIEEREDLKQKGAKR